MKNYLKLIGWTLIQPLLAFAAELLSCAAAVAVLACAPAWRSALQNRNDNFALLIRFAGLHEGNKRWMDDPALSLPVLALWCLLRPVVNAVVFLVWLFNWLVMFTGLLAWPDLAMSKNPRWQGIMDCVGVYDRAMTKAVEE